MKPEAKRGVRLGDGKKNDKMARIRDIRFGRGPRPTKNEVQVLARAYLAAIARNAEDHEEEDVKE